MSELTFTDANFDLEVLNSKDPVLVDFWAPWCGPCKMQGPVIEALAKVYHGKPVKIGKLNVDESPNSANKFHVMSIPTLIIFKNGKPMEQMMGVQDKDTVQRRLDKFIS